MAIFTAVLRWLVLHPWAIALVVVGAWGAKGRIQASVATHARDTAVATLTAEENAHKAALAAAQAAAAAERLRVLTAQQKALDDANERTKRAQADRARSAASLADAQRLLHDAIARSGGGPDADGATPAGDGTAARRLGSLLDTCATEYRQLALDADAAVDQARIAGQSCEASYDSLTLTSRPTTP